MRRFDETQRDSSIMGKECSNLASMLAHMYNFQVVHSLLLFDVLRRLLLSFTPLDVELMLLLLRNVGFSLRKDDPLGLKELISEAQRKASTEGSRFSDQTRVRNVTCPGSEFHSRVDVISLAVQNSISFHCLRIN